MSPSTITIIGLGYGDVSARSLGAQQALDDASRIVLRTAIHLGIDDLTNDPRVVACDDLYESADSFAGVYRGVIDRVLRFAETGDVVFALPGSPSYGERTVRELLAAAAGCGHQVKMIASPSGLDAVAQVMGLDLLSDQVQVIDAASIGECVLAEPFSGSAIGLDPRRTVVVGQVYARPIASDVKHWLTRIFPENHQVSIVSNARIPGQSTIVHTPLSELDHHDFDHLTTVVVAPLDSLEAQRSAATLHHIIAHLRAEDGCPWDRQQTHLTLKDKVIEEAHEVAEAIDNGDPDELAGELGDLLLLVALHAQIAEEAGTFTIEDIYGHVNSKLVRRHPHVFGDGVAETPEQVLTTWRGVKAQEKHGSRHAGSEHRFDQLPRTMSVIQRIRRSEPQFEELPDSQFSEKLGQGLLELVNSSLRAGIDPEAALEKAYRRALDAAITRQE
ncbi:nucleoside triphosphate pyrophosphohydrolase [soil metagenome]